MLILIILLPQDFKTRQQTIKKRTNTLRKLITRTTNWNKKSLEFMEAHQYYTPYCQDLLEEGKQKNIERLRNKISKNEIEEADCQEAGQPT